MMNVSKYNEPFTRLVQSEDFDDLNQPVETFTPTGYLWGKLEITTGQKADQYAGPNTGAIAVIRIRQFPTLSPKDRLQDTNGRVWRLDSVVKGDDELICQVFQLDVDSD